MVGVKEGVFYGHMGGIGDKINLAVMEPDAPSIGQMVGGVAMREMRIVSTLISSGCLLTRCPRPKRRRSHPCWGTIVSGTNMFQSHGGCLGPHYTY